MSFGGGTSGGSQSQQTNQTTNQNGSSNGSYANGAINAEQLQGALNSAQGLYNYGNPTINAGLSNINNGANAAANTYGAANPTLTNTLNGNFLSANNPYFQQMFQGVANAVTPAVASQFEGNGRYGSGAMANALTSNLSQEAGSLAYGNYANERGLQNSALQQIPSYTSGMMLPGQAQLTAGYTPINQYIQALGSISPGTQGTYGQQTSSDINQFGNSSGQAASSNFSAKTGK